MNAVARFDDYADGALRVPPNAIEAEQTVLGALMLDPTSLAKISDWLHEDDFYRRDHRMLYRCITELIGRGTPVDAVTMTDWFDEAGLIDLLQDRGYLIDLQSNAPSAANIVAHAEIVAEKARLRNLIDIGCKLSEGAYARTADALNLVADASHTLSQLSVNTQRSGLETMGPALSVMWEESLRRAEQTLGLYGAQTPWEDLDDCMHGWEDSSVYIVAARPSMGKSIFGFQVAVHSAVVLGNRTAVFSVEMAKAQVAARMAACLGQIEHSWVKQPTKDRPDDDLRMARLGEAMKRIKTAPLLIDDTPALALPQFMARARRAHLQSPLRMVLLDHMHDMKIDSAKARFEYGDIVQGGKTLAKEFKCPVIILAQLSRKLVDRTVKRPNMADLRESGEIEQKADGILFLHRDDYYDKEHPRKGIVTVIPGKGRDIALDRDVYLQNIFSESRLASWLGDVPPEQAYHDQPRRAGGLRNRSKALFGDNQ
jgi:replicative DNA helicase